MIKDSKSTWTKKLKSLMKTELRIVYITKNDKTFLNLNDALEQQEEEESTGKGLKKKEEMIVKIHEILSKVLAKNEWGVFYKSNPLEIHPVQDGTKMYKVNEIDSDKLYDEIDNVIREMENTWEKNIKEGPTDNESSIG